MAAASRKTTVARTAAARFEPAGEPDPQSLDAAVTGPVAEIQQSLRATAEKSLVDSRAAFVAVKASADEAVSALEVSLAATRDGVLAINAKAFEALRANAEANFDYVKAAFAAKSVSEMVALQNEFSRKQVEAIAAQTKDIGALAQKAMTEAFEPIKEQVAKSFRIAV
jgi:phasin